MGLGLGPMCLRADSPTTARRGFPRLGECKGLYLSTPRGQVTSSPVPFLARFSWRPRWARDQGLANWTSHPSGRGVPASVTPEGHSVTSLLYNLKGKRAARDAAVSVCCGIPMHSPKFYLRKLKFMESKHLSKVQFRQFFIF